MSEVRPVVFGATGGPTVRRERKLSPREVALHEAQAIREEASREGYASGYAEGLIQGHEAGMEAGRLEGLALIEAEHRARLEAEIAEFRSALEEVSAQLPIAVEAWYVAAEQRLAGMAVEVVRRVLGQELAHSSDAILGIVRTAISEVDHARSVRVRINPFDAPTLVRAKEDILLACAGVRDLEVVSDPAILSGCVVESDHGLVDARVSTTLSLLEQEAA